MARSGFKKHCWIKSRLAEALILTFSPGEKGLPLPLGEDWGEGTSTFESSCKKFISLLTAAAVIGGAAALFGQEGAKSTKPAEGMLTLEGKNYPLTHARAYETTINDEEMIAVVLSAQAVSSEKLKEAQKAETEGDEPRV